MPASHSAWSGCRPATGPWPALGRPARRGCCGCWGGGCGCCRCCIAAAPSRDAPRPPQAGGPACDGPAPLTVLASGGGGGDGLGALAPALAAAGAPCAGARAAAAGCEGAPASRGCEGRPWDSGPGRRGSRCKGSCCTGGGTLAWRNALRRLAPGRQMAGPSASPEAGCFGPHVPPQPGAAPATVLLPLPMPASPGWERRGPLWRDAGPPACPPALLRLGELLPRWLLRTISAAHAMGANAAAPATVAVTGVSAPTTSTPPLPAAAPPSLLCAPAQVVRSLDDATGSAALQGSAGSCRCSSRTPSCMAAPGNPAEPGSGSCCGRRGCARPSAARSRCGAGAARIGRALRPGGAAAKAA